MALTPATRILLQRGIQRAGFVLQDVLLERRFPPSDTVATLPKFSVQPTGQEPYFAVKDSEMESVAFESVAPIIAAIEALVWHEMVVALVMERRFHLEGLGRFELDADRDIVRFNASPVVADLDRPELEPDDTALGDAIAFCNREVRSQRFAKRAWEAALQEASRTQLSALYATDLMSQAIAWRRPGTLSEIAALLAAIAYFGWLMAFAAALRHAGAVDISNIGTFSVNLGVIEFTLARDLIDLLSANTQVY